MTSAGPEMIRDFCPLPLMEQSGQFLFLSYMCVFVCVCGAAAAVSVRRRKVFACLFSCSLSLIIVREWNVERLLGTAQKVLPHPSFVYCARYHPAAQNLVLTGGFDALLRVWRVDVDDVNGQLLQEFDGHGNFINTICFDSEGTRFVMLSELNPVRHQ